jgi:hypothetical protein
MNSGQVAKRIGGQIPVRYLDAGVKRALCGDDLGREDAAHWVFAEDAGIDVQELHGSVSTFQQGLLRIDLEHHHVRVTARRHEGAFQRAERKALANQFGQNLGDVLQLARYMMDLLNALRGYIFR